MNILQVKEKHARHKLMTSAEAEILTKFQSSSCSVSSLPSELISPKPSSLQDIEQLVNTKRFVKNPIEEEKDSGKDNILSLLFLICCVLMTIFLFPVF
jgi:hypothetical protein